IENSSEIQGFDFIHRLLSGVTAVQYQSGREFRTMRRWHPALVLPSHLGASVYPFSSVAFRAHLPITPGTMLTDPGRMRYVVL
ncbi:MAG: hypothetical protein OXM02_09475, partial [Bacteroidota bacterium]|nr:hypothetical protein [Bacteroidota bacterium]